MITRAGIERGMKIRRSLLWAHEKEPHMKLQKVRIRTRTLLWGMIDEEQPVDRRIEVILIGNSIHWGEMRGPNHQMSLLWGIEEEEEQQQ
jgi:hypothetical protein